MHVYWDETGVCVSSMMMACKLISKELQDAEMWGTWVHVAWVHTSVPVPGRVCTRAHTYTLADSNFLLHVISKVSKFTCLLSRRKLGLLSVICLAVLGLIWAAGAEWGQQRTKDASLGHKGLRKQQMVGLTGVSIKNPGVVRVLPGVWGRTSTARTLSWVAGRDL